MSPELRTERLILRRAQRSDLHDLHAVMSDAEAMRFWSTPPHRSLAETRDWLDRMIAASPEESDDYVIEFERRVIGKAGCWRIPEIGYILNHHYWGLGLAREAMQAVIERAFRALRLPELTAEVDPRNAASLKLLAALGFLETGRAARTWCVAGEWSDSVYLALPRPEAMAGQGVRAVSVRAAPRPTSPLPALWADFPHRGKRA